MDVIPILHLKQPVLMKGNELTSIREKMDAHSLSSLYIIDEMGIHRNHPQVDFYQKISKIYEIWVDAGPRDVGDIVDIVFAGAKNIVLRPSTWVEPDVRTIRDITEHQLFCHYDIDLSQRERVDSRQIPIYDFDGKVVFVHGNWDKRRFSTEEAIKRLGQEVHSFIYAPRLKDKMFWKSFGFGGMFVNLDYFDEGLV